MDQDELNKRLAEAEARSKADAERLKKVEARLYAESLKRREGETKIFCAELKTKGVIVPAFEAQAVAALNAAAALDEKVTSETGVHQFTDALQGKTFSDTVKDLLCALPKYVEFGEKVPAGELKPGVTPGATPPAPAQPGVRTFTQPNGRVIPVLRDDLLKRAQEFRAKHQGMSLESAVAEIQRQDASKAAGAN